MTKTRCIVCSEENVEPGHEDTKRHRKNAGLEQLAKMSKLLGENRHGIKVTCTVCPTAYNSQPIWSNREQSKLEVSVKPLQDIRFTFAVCNDNAHEIVFEGVEMLNGPKLNFTLNNNNHVAFGTSAHRIPPRRSLEEQVSVTFETHLVGTYKMPISFFFANKETGTSTIIIKEIMVFVETVRKTHEVVTSPFTQETVNAEKIVPSTYRRMRENIYAIPSRDHKIVFIHHLKTDGNKLTEEQKSLTASIRDTLEAGPTQDNYAEYFHNLLWFEESIIGLNLMSYNMSGVTLLPRGTKRKCYALQVPGLAEKRPSLMLGDLVHVRPHDQTAILFECVITGIEDNYALLGRFNSEFNPGKGLGYYAEDAQFDVRFFMSRIPMERMHTAVASVLSTAAISKIYPKKNKSPKINAIKTQMYFNASVALNPEQRTVVEHVVGGSSGAAPYLLFGPPGTGKTVTIVEAILQLARNPSNRILVCTDSNMAADHVATKLAEYRECFADVEAFILRANSKDRMWESLPACLAKYSNGTDRDSYSPVSVKTFLSYRIVVTTLIHSAKYGRELKNKKYGRKTTHVFIDEAAQASEPAALVPVCGLLAPAGTLVLAGDPQQLGPVCISRDAKDKGLGMSLMERLKKNCSLYSDSNPDPNYIVMLKKNFRSHADILSIPSELFYSGQLEARAELDPISYVDILGEKTKSRAIVFHGVLSSEQRMGRSPSFFNAMELEIIQSYVLALVKQHQVRQQDIGVVTPYMRQVSKVKAWLKAALLERIEVGTVEAFQGKEKRVIILSCVRANCNLFAHDAKYRLGFLVDAKRFNVAMTRAKAKLVVIGNPLCLRKDERWTKYMQKCRELGTYTGFDAGVDETDDEVLDHITPMIEMMIKNIETLSV